MRLRLFSECIKHEREVILREYPWLQNEEHQWENVDSSYRKLASRAYHEDLAVAYLNSIRRNIFERNRTELLSTGY